MGGFPIPEKQGRTTPASFPFPVGIAAVWIPTGILGINMVGLEQVVTNAQTFTAGGKLLVLHFQFQFVYKIIKTFLFFFIVKGHQPSLNRKPRQ